MGCVLLPGVQQWGDHNVTAFRCVLQVFGCVGVVRYSLITVCSVCRVSVTVCSITHYLGRPGGVRCLIVPRCDPRRPGHFLILAALHGEFRPVGGLVHGQSAVLGWRGGPVLPSHMIASPRVSGLSGASVANSVLQVRFSHGTLVNSCPQSAVVCFTCPLCCLVSSVVAVTGYLPVVALAVVSVLGWGPPRDSWRAQMHF